MADQENFDDVPWHPVMTPDDVSNTPFELIVSDGEMVKVPSKRLGIMLARGASPATAADLAAHKQRRALADEMQRQTGTIPYTLETLRRYTQGFMGGFDVFRPITKGISHIATAAGLMDKPVTDEDYDRISAARQALAPAGTQTAAELLGYISPFGLEAAATRMGTTLAAKATGLASAVGAEARAALVAEGTMTAAEAATAAARAEAAAVASMPELAAQLAGKTAAGKAAMLSPLTWMGKAGATVTGATETALLKVLPDAGAAGNAARFLLPRIAGGAMEGALFGAEATAEEISAGRMVNANQAAEALAANMKGHALLFGAIGGATGVLETGLGAAADAGVKFGHWWKESSPFPWSHKSVLESWKRHPDQSKVATALLLAEKPEALGDFLLSVQNGTSLLLDSTPAQAAWMIENREALAAVAKKGGPAAVNKFRGFEVGGEWDQELATQMLRDYPRMVSESERKLLVSETIDGINKMLQFGDDAMHAMNTRLLERQKVSMKSVGQPGGPPSNEAIYDGAKDAFLSIKDAIAEAESNPAKYSDEFVNILRSARAELNAEINGLKAADEPFDTLAAAIKAAKKDPSKYGSDAAAALEEAKAFEPNIRHKIKTEKTDIVIEPDGKVVVGRWKARPAYERNPDGTFTYDAEAVYDAIRKVRTNLNEAIADQNAKYVTLSSAQKQTMNLLEGTAGKLAGNIHDAGHWGEFAVDRSRADELMAKYLENMVSGGAFSDGFLMKKAVKTTKGLDAGMTAEELAARPTTVKEMMVVDPGKLDSYFKNLGGFKTETQSSVEGGYALSEALAKFRSDFVDLVRGTERLTPGLAVETTGARMSKRELEDFIFDFERRLNETSERIKINNAWSDADKTAQMRFNTRYDPKGKEEPIQHAVEKTVFGSALKVAKTVFSKSPEWQWQLEPRLRAMAASAKMTGVMDQRIEAAAKKLASVATSAKPVLQIGLTQTPVGETLGAKQLAMPVRGKAKGKVEEPSEEQREKDREDYKKQIKEARRLATDVNALAERVNGLMGAANDPELAQALTNWVQAAAQEIADAAPNVPDEDADRFIVANPNAALDKSGAKYTPTDEEIQKHKRIIAATTGVGLLDLAMNGKLTHDEVRIADRLVPGLMVKMRMELERNIKELQDKGESINPAYRSTLETLLDRPFDVASTPAISAKTQRVYSRIRMGKAEAEGDRAMPSSRAKGLDVSDSYKTPQQRANQR